MADTVNQELGLLFQGPNYVIVKKGGKAGEKVEKHNHPEANVIFTVVKGNKIYVPFCTFPNKPIWNNSRISIAIPLARLAQNMTFCFRYIFPDCFAVCKL